MSLRQNAPFWVQMHYVFRMVWADLIKKKYGTILTVLVIAVSLTIPTVSFLLWKNTHQAATEFYPESELTVYLHKNLSEEDANAVVDKSINDVDAVGDAIRIGDFNRLLEAGRTWIFKCMCSITWPITSAISPR